MKMSKVVTISLLTASLAACDDPPSDGAYSQDQATVTVMNGDKPDEVCHLEPVDEINDKVVCENQKLPDNPKTEALVEHKTGDVVSAHSAGGYVGDTYYPYHSSFFFWGGNGYSSGWNPVSGGASSAVRSFSGGGSGGVISSSASVSSVARGGFGMTAVGGGS